MQLTWSDGGISSAVVETAIEENEESHASTATSPFSVASEEPGATRRSRNGDTPASTPFTGIAGRMSADSVRI